MSQYSPKKSMEIECMQCKMFGTVCLRTLQTSVMGSHKSKNTYK